MKLLVPLQNFIEESNFFFGITPSTPTGSLSRNPINTAPVTVDYKTSRKTTPKTTTRGQNIAISPVITSTTTKTVLSTVQSRDIQTTINQATASPTESDAVTTQAVAFPTKAAAVGTTTITTTQETAFPTKPVQVEMDETTTAGDDSFGTATSGGTMTTGNGDWDLIISEVIPTKSG